MEVRASGEAAQPHPGGPLRLEEGRSYFVALGPDDPEGTRISLGPLALEWDPRERGFRIPPWFSVGAQTLHCVQGDKRWTEGVQFIASAEKLAEQSWPLLLAELEAWLPGLAVGALPGLQGTVAAGGGRVPLLVEAALPLIPALMDSLRAIIAAPRARTDFHEEHRPAHQVRRVERTTLGWLQRHPEATRALGVSWTESSTAKRSPFVPVHSAVARLDHPVNRYVSWLVQALARDLGSYAEQLRAPGRSRSAPAGTEAADWERWCEARADRLRDASSELLAQVRSSWLSTVTPAPPTEAALAVAMDDPHYARLHRLGRHLRSPLFQQAPSTRPNGVATRPTYELYELWTFFAVRRLLDTLLEGYRWTAEGLEPLGVLGEALDGACFKAEGPGGWVQLLFNPTFRGFLPLGTGPSRFSISKERRPDLVLHWSLQGRVGWVSLDAKYRVSRSGLADAFESAHLYRDSLRWPDAGGHCEASVLLAPAELPACAPWFKPEFLREHRVGIFRLAPGHATDPLSAWLGALLQR